MRKYFEGHSLTGVVIILSVFFFAVFLRYFDIGTQSPWTDELASWWYMRHLGEVWSRESHSPLYYALLRVFTGESNIETIREFSATVSVIHLVGIFFLGQIAFDKKKFLILWILVCLNPSDIIFARMARHYAWLMEGILVYYLLWRIRAPLWLQALNAGFMGFIHVFSVIPVSFLAFYRFWQDKDKKTLCGILLSVNLIVIYYLLKIFILGHEQVRANLLWSDQSQLIFWSSVITQFMGSVYPRFEFFPVGLPEAFLVVGATTLWAIYRKKESAILFVGIFFASLLIVEAFSFWVNLRVNRYLIYLIGFWLVAIVDSFGEVKRWHIVSLFSLLSGFIVWQNPVKNFAWEKEKVELWRDYRKKYPASQELVFSNMYQSDYYHLNAGYIWQNSLFNIDPKKELLFFDLNGSDRLVAFNLLSVMDVVEYIPLKFGSIARYVPKKKKKGVR